MFGVSTPLDSLTDGSAGVAAFDDLAEGPSYGSLLATDALEDTVDIELDETGLAFLEASAGPLAIGGAMTTLAKGATNEFLFNSTSAGLTRRLVVTVE
jgi:hypothetical protein